MDLRRSGWTGWTGKPMILNDQITLRPAIITSVHLERISNVDLQTVHLIIIIARHARQNSALFPYCGTVPVARGPTVDFAEDNLGDKGFERRHRAANNGDVDF
jgi:hypothetical protein